MKLGMIALGSAALVVAACSTLLEPAQGPQGQPFPDRTDDPVEIQVPGTSAKVIVGADGELALVTPPGTELDLAQPISFPLAGMEGYGVTVYPDGSVALQKPGTGGPPASRPTTNADVALDVLAGTAGAVGGNPMLATLVAGLGHALIGVFARKKKPAAA